MTSPPIANMSNRLTIGLFLGQLEERFQSRVWPGVVKAANARGVNLICFPGGQINIEPNELSQRNVIYKYASPRYLDGLIIMSVVLGNFLDANEVSAFCELFRPLPMVSISLSIANIPSILVDNYQGIYNTTTHLIEQHNRQQIDFYKYY